MYAQNTGIPFSDYAYYLINITFAKFYLFTCQFSFVKAVYQVLNYLVRRTFAMTNSIMFHLLDIKKLFFLYYYQTYKEHNLYINLYFNSNFDIILITYQFELHHS